MAEGGVTQVPSPPDHIVVRGVFLALTPHEMFRVWTEPAGLTQWWPHEAEIDLQPDGSYHLSWPSMDWHLRGRYTTLVPDRRLAFTWNWDHDDYPERTVDVCFEPFADGGTQLTLTHGTYTEADTEEREGHLSGWLHFLGRLYMQSPQMVTSAE